MAIESVAAFLSELEGFDAPKGGLRAFRGSRATWEPLPGILRPEHQNLLAHERDAVREMLSVRPSDFESDKSMFDRLVRMQHFGLPTRLLDVTANPLVALYFATEEVDTRLEEQQDGIVEIMLVPPTRKKYFDSDTVSCVSNLANLSADEKRVIQQAPEDKFFNMLDEVDRLHQFIRSEKPYFRPSIRKADLNKIWYVVPKLSNNRIVAQTGAFLLFGLMPSNTVSPDYISIPQLDIDKQAKQAIRRELVDIGISQRTLFPEIDAAASYVAEQFS